MYKAIIALLLCLITSVGFTSFNKNTDTPYQGDASKNIIQCVPHSYELKTGLDTVDILSGYVCILPDIFKKCLFIKGMGIYCWSID